MEPRTPAAAVALAVAVATEFSTLPARAAPSADPPAPRVAARGPFPRGAVMPALGLSGSFSRNFGTLSVALGATYFVWHGVGLGLSVRDTVFFYGRALRESYPGIERQTTTNIFEILPSLTWLFVRTPRFSPYVRGGVGPVFFNHGGGIHGRWRAAAGAYIGLGGPAYLAIGASFTSLFPGARCRRAFEYRDASGEALQVFSVDPCSFAWGPVLSLAFTFGGGR